MDDRCFAFVKPCGFEVDIHNEVSRLGRKLNLRNLSDFNSVKLTTSTRSPEKKSEMSKTPKKIYAAPSNATNSCGLYKSVGGSAICKNLLRKANRTLLVAAEGTSSSLQRSELLLHLLCRPCRRRLKNFIAFNTLILQSLRSLERVPRCI